MFKFKELHDNSDATTTYEVILSREYPVCEFMFEAIERSRGTLEWGTFTINSFSSGHSCEYRCGHVVSSTIPESVARARIKEVIAIGGWGSMNYYIKTKEVETMPEEHAEKTNPFNELRTAAGMSRKAFAEYFEIAARTVDHWDSGDRKCPEYLLKLMKYKLEKEGKING